MRFSAAIILSLLAPAATLVPPSRRTCRALPLTTGGAQVTPQATAAAAAAFAVVLSSGSPAFAGDIDAGAAVFSANCAACHAGGNNVIYPEKTLRKEALESYLSGGFKESSVVTQVTNGKNAMPAFGGRLEDDEIENVASYVIDQATGGKW